MTAQPLTQVNTCICYKYRDGANYKFPGAVVLEGPITEEQIRPYLHEGLYFIPGDAGLPGLHPTHCEFDEDLDHPWHELDSVEPTEAQPTAALTVEEFLQRLQEAAQAGWPGLPRACRGGSTRTSPGSEPMNAVATQQLTLLSVQPVCEEVVVRRWRSQVRPDVVVTDEKHDLPVLRWADAHPHVYEIASGTRSKVFGRNSCAHIGWAQRGKAPAAIFERIRTLYDGLRDPLKGGGIFQWRAQFTFEHYEDKEPALPPRVLHCESTTASTRGGTLVAGVAVSLPSLSGAEGSKGPAMSLSKGFTGGVFFTVTETPRGYGDLLTLDYTPALIDDVARRFAAWARRHPRSVAVVVKKKNWKGQEVHRWDWEELLEENGEWRMESGEWSK
ncbi:MAG: hypothetical protein SXV54_23090 [Chloroflexota bacterium]|nr:hypothetical protein [Chloroflexota bacterium]